MALHIKHPQAEQLAQKVAALSGESPAQAIVLALQERLERLNMQKSANETDLVEKLMEISRRCSRLPDLDNRSAEEILDYDELGIFRDGH